MHTRPVLESGQILFRPTCEMARELLIADRTTAPAGEGLSYQNIGGNQNRLRQTPPGGAFPGRASDAGKIRLTNQRQKRRDAANEGLNVPDNS